MSKPPARSPVVRAITVAGGALFVIALGWGVVTYLTVFARVPGPWSTATGLRPVIVDVALFSIFALHHSAFARAGLKQWIEAHLPGLERTVYVSVASLLFIAMLSVWSPVPGVAWQTHGLVAVVLACAQVGGLLLTAQSARRLGVLELAGVDLGAGKTEARPATLRETGVYGLVRHPIYMAWLLMVWPVPTMTGSRLVFAIVSTAYLAAAIPLEERSLVREFGPAYRDYQRKVRWRMVPFLY